MPAWVEPMLATLTEERDLGDGWILERKLDGVRCLAFVRKGKVKLLSRTRKPLAYAPVAEALSGADDMILDGEVVAVDENGEPLGFQALQRHGDPVLWAFDVLWHRGDDLRERPLTERRKVLERLVTPGGAVARSEQLKGPSTQAYEKARGNG